MIHDPTERYFDPKPRPIPRRDEGKTPMGFVVLGCGLFWLIAVAMFLFMAARG